MWAWALDWKRKRLSRTLRGLWGHFGVTQRLRGIVMPAFNSLMTPLRGHPRKSCCGWWGFICSQRCLRSTVEFRVRTSPTNLPVVQQSRPRSRTAHPHASHALPHTLTHTHTHTRSHMPTHMLTHTQGRGRRAEEGRARPHVNRGPCGGEWSWFFITFFLRLYRTETGTWDQLPPDSRLCFYDPPSLRALRT